MLHPRLVEHSKEVARFAPVKPAVKAGLRAALATVLPVLLSTSLNLPGGLWMSVGGFNTSFSDKGGSYGTRARSMAIAAVAGALSVLVGSLAGHHPAIAIPVTLVWVSLCSFAGVHGAAANLAGNTAASTFVISLALPAASVGAAFEESLFLLAGALWAMVLSLVLWPIRPYRPARLAIARCFRLVADYAAELERLAPGTDEAAWQALIQAQHGRIREALEDARITLVATRRGRGERGRGEKLLVLLQSADMMFMSLIALGDDLESLRMRRPGAPGTSVATSLSALSRTLQEIAHLVETEGRARQLPALDWPTPRIPPEVAPSRDTVRHALSEHLVGVLAQLREYAGTAIDTAASLPDSRPLPRERALSASPLVEPELSLWAPVKENLTLDSVVLRHALRVGLTTTVAVGITTLLRPSHGYWVTITVLTILLPYTGPTFLKALQRVLGTVVGGILAIGIASWLHDPHALMALVFVTATVCVSVISLNYGLYTVFVTLTFVLLAEVGTGDWSLAQVRIDNTLIGGALALAGSWLLWERSERERFPTQIAAALRANAALLHQVLPGHLGEARAPTPVASEARRALGLAALNAEASFQRLLSEPRRRSESLEPLMTLLAFTRRFAAAVITLASTRHPRPSEPALRAVERFTRASEQSLEDLAEALSQRRAPVPLPPFTELLGWNVPHASPDARTLALESPLLQAQLERISRQLTILHGAALRRQGSLRG
ncbi:FUSC family protein [Corallococcus sp. M34]|uniref:FUSC family protein n=1 Tax=Citreicoccus inhibens TaxID=2849499 RepID=UPI001C23A2C2|nr:FUSC family protein [Citreicoccus inhibens]MBU8894837.1 FUSC family protein [Citreicoccus inhibens]